MATKTPKEIQEIEFNKEHSRYKLVMFFPKRTITYHPYERTQCTEMQIRWRHIRKLALDREKGLRDCIDHIARMEIRYGRYNAAFIYDKFRNGMEIRKYIDNILVEEDTKPLPENEKQCFFDVIYPPGYQELKGGYKLVEIKEEIPVGKIDFKKEVATAISKPLTRQRSLVYIPPDQQQQNDF